MANVEVHDSKIRLWSLTKLQTSKRVLFPLQGPSPVPLPCPIPCLCNPMLPVSMPFPPRDGKSSFWDTERCGINKCGQRFASLSDSWVQLYFGHGIHTKHGLCGSALLKNRAWRGVGRHPLLPRPPSSSLCIPQESTSATSGMKAP